jgi:hypothetical protein
MTPLGSSGYSSTNTMYRTLESLEVGLKSAPCPLFRFRQDAVPVETTKSRSILSKCCQSAASGDWEKAEPTEHQKFIGKAGQRKNDGVFVNGLGSLVTCASQKCWGFYLAREYSISSELKT